MRVLVIGGGIGGLTTALSLHAAGIETTVFEQVVALSALGLGINLQPNAVRELDELGLAGALADTAIETSTVAFYNKHGQNIWAEPRGRAAGYNWPQYSIHRGDLLMILLDAVRARIGSENIRTGHQFMSFEQDAHAVTAHFIDRTTGQPLPPQRGDVLIGADGINSSVRRQLYPNEGRPTYSGRTQWRGAIEAAPFLDGRTQVMIGHLEQRAVVYPISKTAAARGRSRINWLTVLGNRNDDERESWDRKVPKERFFAPFAHWNFDWIPLADLISATEEIFEYPESDRDPLPRWSFGRVTLVGDAAHPMRPIGSQAGSQGIIDARVLVQALAGTPDRERALRDYEAVRLPMMNDVVMRNRNFGPEIVMQTAEDRAPQGFNNIEDVIPRRELEEVARSFKVAAGFDAETVNKRASYGVQRP